MSIRHLHIEVRWPDGRTVQVDVRVEPVLGPTDETDILRNPRSRARTVVHLIDAMTLSSRSTLLSFLANATRGEDTGAVIPALCLEPRLPKLLKLLGVKGRPSKPIPVEVTDDD